MDVIYLQADLRHNDRLLRLIQKKRVIEYTLARIGKLNCKKMIAGIYDCVENGELIDALKTWGGG